MAIGTSATLFEDVAHGIVGADAATGEILAVNDAFCDIVGHADRELVGTDLAAVAAGESSPLARPVLRQARTESARIEWRLRTRCEGVVPVEGRLTITEQDGREVALASVARREPDATERNPVEADATGLDALETGEESAVGDERWPSGFQRHRDRYRTLFENEDLVLWEQDFSAAREYATELADTGEELGAHIDEHPEELLEILARMDVHMVNDAALDFYGVESKTQLVENFDEMMVPDTCEGLTEMWKAVVDGQRYFCTECKFRPLDGDEIRYELMEVYVPERHAEDYSLVFTTATDITERKRREQELRAAHDARRALQETLVDPTSIDVFAEAVCAQLTAIDDVGSARVVTVGPGDALEPLAAAGADETQANLAVDDLSNDEHPAAVAVRERRTVSIDPDDAVRDHPGEQPPAGVVAVPVTHDGVTRGALAVRLAGQRAVGDERLHDLLRESADVLGYAMGSAQRRRALSADDRIELTVEVGTGETPLSRAADAADTAATVTAVVPRGDGDALCYVVGDRPDAFAAAARETGDIEQVDRVDGDPSRLQVAVSGEVPTAVVAEHGGDVVDATVDGTTTTLTAQFPRGTAFDPVFDALGDRYGEVRTADYTTKPADPDAAGDPLSGLTDRQREVLEAAVRAGYFERPRALNATEMADRLGVSRQAFQQVLRAAQRNAFAELFPTE
jgi:PAS domain S-box-containing protein